MQEKKMKKLIVLLTSILLFTSFMIGARLSVASVMTENTWQTKAPMPQAALGGKAAVVDGKIYVIGGAVNYEYNPLTNNWTTKAPMPIPRTGFGMAVYQSKIYTFGGLSWLNPENPTFYNVTEVYNPLTDSWQNKASVPTNRYDLEANAVNGTIYLISGYTGAEYSTVDLNQAYNIANDSWTTKAPLPYTVEGYASAVSDNRIYIFGGQDQNLPKTNELNLNTTQIYNPGTDSWALGSPMPTIVLNAAAGATIGQMAPKRIYVIGGMPNIEMSGSNLTQVYDPKTDTWMYGASKPTDREALTVTVVNDILYAIGGQEIVSAPTSPPVNEQYTPFGYGTVGQSNSSPASKAEAFLILIIVIVTTSTVLALLVFVSYRIKRKNKYNSTCNICEVKIK